MSSVIQKYEQFICKYHDTIQKLENTARLVVTFFINGENEIVSEAGTLRDWLVTTYPTNKSVGYSALNLLSLLNEYVLARGKVINEKIQDGTWILISLVDLLTPVCCWC